LGWMSVPTSRSRRATLGYLGAKQSPGPGRLPGPPPAGWANTVFTGASTAGASWREQAATTLRGKCGAASQRRGKPGQRAPQFLMGVGDHHQHPVQASRHKPSAELQPEGLGPTGSHCRAQDALLPSLAHPPSPPPPPGSLSGRPGALSRTSRQTRRAGRRRRPAATPGTGPALSPAHSRSGRPRCWKRGSRLSS
jgi:hypothetical protein